MVITSLQGANAREDARLRLASVARQDPTAHLFVGVQLTSAPTGLPEYLPCSCLNFRFLEKVPSSPFQGGPGVGCQRELDGGHRQGE